MEIRQEVIGHLHQMFDEIEETVRLFPDDLWTRDSVEDLMMAPAFLAHHTIWCMRLRHLLDIPEDELPANPAPGHYSRDCVPSKEQLLAFLDGIRSYSTSHHGQMANDGYLSKRQAPFQPIGMVIYTIAHTRQHMGQLVQILKENGTAPPKWYPR